MQAEKALLGKPPLDYGRVLRRVGGAKGRVTKLSRRDFLVTGSLYGGGLWISLSLPRPRAEAAAVASVEPESLRPAEWRALDAVAARILPSDEGPGAREAGCVSFVDKALANEDAEALPLYRVGLAALDDASRARHEKPFAELRPGEQDALLADCERGAVRGWSGGAVEPGAFFETVRAHVLIGFLADPRHGGNRDHAGWRLVGYPGPRHHRGGYTPAQMMGREKIRTVWGEDV